MELFANKVLALRAQRRAPGLPGNEARLLQQINYGVTPEVRKRYEARDAKLHEETLTSAEHQEWLWCMKGGQKRYEEATLGLCLNEQSLTKGIKR